MQVRPARVRRRRATLVLTACVCALVMLLANVAASSALASTTACSRIRVESRDRTILLSTYVVSDFEYVAAMRARIEQYGQNGSWVVPAGDLGPLGYTVTYTCLASVLAAAP